VLTDQPPLRLVVSGPDRSERSVWMGIERSRELTTLHERLMRALQPFERKRGDVRAFVDADTGSRAIRWVGRYRRDAAFERFRPHVTLGHAKRLQDVPPLEFDATAIAACHLGHFCSCRRVLRVWQLGRRAEA
jgi:hypothetical protein